VCCNSPQAAESHTLVASRTSELERIHATSILLHQLKLFVHAKASLEAYTQKPDETGTDVTLYTRLKARTIAYIPLSLTWCLRFPARK
jgi:hypothetical protein